MRKILMAGVIVGCLTVAAHLAQATVVFNGSGASGQLAAATETWRYGGASPPGTTDVGWGSPGLGSGLALFGEAMPATIFEITFITATIDAGQIPIGAMSACAGGSSGGTTFCSLGSGGLVPWSATLVGSHGIAFTAPTGTTLSDDGSYFANIFLTAGSGVSGGQFSGSWSAAPEPASGALLAVALIGLCRIRRRTR